MRLSTTSRNHATAVLDASRTAMKKTFRLTHPKIKVARLFDSARGDINKYLKRERKKTLPEGADFWDFDCKFGLTAEEAEAVHVADITKRIDAAETQEAQSFYIEILAKPVQRTKRPKPK